MRQPNTILEELHAIRNAIAEASDQDLKRMAEAATARQQQSGREIVRLSPKRIDDAKKAS